MKRKLVVWTIWIFLAGVLLPGMVTAQQTIAYRQTNLAADSTQFSATVNPLLKNPWGMAFLPGQPFFIANNGTGTVAAFDASGSSQGLTSFLVLNEATGGAGTPTGIVADVNNLLGGAGLRQPLIMVAEEGTVFVQTSDPHNTPFPDATAAFFDTNAVYKGVAILTPQDTGPALAITDFRGGLIQLLTTGFALLEFPPGAFTDPNLPAGYAPFGIQVIGQQVFVTYAVQDAAKHDPVPGAGNGIVDVYNLDGNFVKRFATGGTLNAPWGVTQASANFGPFRNAILIGNEGDGSISAFDPATGNFLGQIKDGNGEVILDLALHALAFRSDGFGDPNTLYLTTGVGGGFGIFGAITPGLVTITNVTQQPGPNGSSVFTATVAPGPGNQGTPTGTVKFSVDGNAPQTVALTGGTANFAATLVGQGEHVIRAIYSGDATFLTSRFRLDVQVAAVPTTTTLNAPANAAPGAAVTFQAMVRGQGGTPTGQVAFQEGNTTLGTRSLDAAGNASFTTSTLSVGAHTVTASYLGDDTFGTSTSAGATITIANADFTLGAAPPSATVTAGQSTVFQLTVTPAGGFANQVTFSCPAINGITCAFNPSTVTPAGGAATTVLKVTTSASVTRFTPSSASLPGVDFLPISAGKSAVWFGLAVLVLLLIATRRRGIGQAVRAPLMTAAAVLALFAVSATLGGCGGSGGGMPANRGTAQIMVTAQSGGISHTTTVSVTVQ